MGQAVPGNYCLSVHFLTGYIILCHFFSLLYRIRQASSQPRREYQPKPRMSLEFATGDSTQPNGGLSHTGTPKPGGKQRKATDPFSWDLGTLEQCWEHSEYPVVSPAQELHSKPLLVRGLSSWTSAHGHSCPCRTTPLSLLSLWNILGFVFPLMF